MGLEHLTTVCEKALVHAEEMALLPGERWVLPDQLVVGLPASQLRGRAWSVVQRRARPDHPIEVRELEALLQRVLRLAVNRLRGESPDAQGWLLVDATLVALTVDDHGVTDPVGFRGREVGATVFAALTRREVVETWGLVAQDLEFTALTLTATPLALASGVISSQGILVDVGGTTTDLIWCRAGRPVRLDSLPTGGAALTNAVMGTWNLGPDRAQRLIQSYSTGRLGAELKAQVLDVLSPSLQTWMAETEKAMIRLNEDEPLPPNLYLTGGGSALPELTEAVRALAWSQHLRFARYPQVSHLRPADVPGVVNRTPLGQKLGDVSALALAGWTARHQRPTDRPARILSELYQSSEEDR
jgi:cell division protein FtsA